MDSPALPAVFASYEDTNVRSDLGLLLLGVIDLSVAARLEFCRWHENFGIVLSSGVCLFAGLNGSRVADE